MAVVGFAHELRGSPFASSESAEGVSISRRFRVEVDSPYDGPAVVLSAPGLPAVGYVYDFGTDYNAYVRCHERTVERIGRSVRFWEVQCKYRTPTKEEREQDRERNPTGDPIFDIPKVALVTAKRQVPFIKDVDGNPVVNGAGELFSPAPRKNRSGARLTIVRNEPLNSPVVAMQDAYLDKVNDATWWERPAGRWICDEINAEDDLRVVTQGETTTAYAYLIVTYQFSSLPADEFEFLNHGYNYWTGGTYPGGHARSGRKMLRSFATLDGYNEIDLLDTIGQPTNTPNYLTFEAYEEADFGALNLPESFIDVAGP